jgi:hypothetical protein
MKELWERALEQRRKEQCDASVRKRPPLTKSERNRRARAKRKALAPS